MEIATKKSAPTRTPAQREQEPFKITINSDQTVTPGTASVSFHQKVIWYNKGAVNVWLRFAEAAVGPENDDDDDIELSFEIPSGSEGTTKKAKKKKSYPGVHYDVLTSAPTKSDASVSKGPPTIIIQ